MIRINDSNTPLYDKKKCLGCERCITVCTNGINTVPVAACLGTNKSPNGIVPGGSDPIVKCDELSEFP